MSFSETTRAVCSCILSEFVAKLRRHQSVLCELMEPDFGLVDHLVGIILSPLAADEIYSAVSSCSRNKIILKNIISCDDRNKQEAFLRALTQTRQQHIVNFINADGGKFCVCFLEWTVLSWFCRTSLVAVSVIIMHSKYRVGQQTGPILTVNNFHYRGRTIDWIVPLFTGKHLLCDSVILVVSYLLHILCKLNDVATSSFCPTVRRR